MRAEGLADSNELSERDTTDRRIPLVILGGFLGAGKTTVLNHLLREAKGRRLAVLVNDVGEVNIDAALARGVTQIDSKSADEIVELSNGCICCGIQDAFGEAVVTLAKQKPDCIVVEATGIAEPQRIIASLVSRDADGVSSLDYVRIANLAALVDAADWVKRMDNAYRPVRRPLQLFSDPRRPLSELLTMQVEIASVIILNKIDRADEEALRRSQESLATINPSAKVVAVRDGQVGIEMLLDSERFDSAKVFNQSRCDLELAGTGERFDRPKGSGPAHDHGEFGLMAFVHKSRYPMSHDKLVAYLRGRIRGLLRAKGFAWTDREPDRIGYLSLAGDALRFDYLGRWMHTLVQNGELDRSQISPEAERKWDAKTGDRRQEIVFIGIDLDRKAIEDELASFQLEKAAL